jgi:hypothetical protein
VNAILLTAVLLSSGSAPDIADLTQVGHIEPNGRVQDQEIGIVQHLIEAGEPAIPFLVGKLEDETTVPGPTLDYWPQVDVGAIALVILTDFVARPGHSGPTIPGLSWDELLNRQDRDTAAWALYADFIEPRPG